MILNAKKLATSVVAPAVVAFGLSLIAGQAQAAIIPVGVQNDVSYDTVVNDWGWDVIYSGAYGDSVSIDTAFTGAKKYVMLAGIHNGSSTIDVLAAALTTDVQTHTPLNATHLANGANWYYNAYSMGFAGPTDTISQNQADINGSSNANQPFERDRLSWHTDITSPDDLPTLINVGWRSGSNTDLNNSTDWTRIIFTSDGAPSAVATPEPSTWAMMALGIGALAFMSRRRKRESGEVAFSGTTA